MTTGRRARALAAVAVALVAAIAGTAPSEATLTGSTFEGNDGNLVSPTAGFKDWEDLGIDCVGAPPAAGANCGVDLPTGQDDDSFGSGPGNKEDSPVPPITTGSIPNNKSDLLRFYVASEKANGDDFLYLAWERVQEPNGTTNMDFEFNQLRTPSANGVTPVRSEGDLLIRYDLAQGGTNPVLRYHRWITDAEDGPCHSAQDVPCWGPEHTLTGANFEGSINTGEVTDPINPDAPRTLSPRTFGEAAINLTDSGILQSGTCQTFGAAFLKSRSSDSFTAAMKDFIAPIPVNITNCGQINIQKNDDQGNALANVEFDVYLNNAPLTAPRGDAVEDPITTMGCTTNASGQCSISDVPFGDYWVVEVAAPTGYTKAADQAVTISAGTSTVTLTFVNNRQPASVTIAKVDDAGVALNGAVFTLYTDVAGVKGSATSFTCTTGLPAGTPAGQCTISNILPAGTYWLVETTVPAGHTAAADRKITLTLGQNLDLTGTPFVDPRIFRVITFVCVDSTDTLYAADVGYDGTTALPSTPVVGGAITTTVETAICGLTGQAVHSHGEGQHTTTVDID